MNDWKKKLLKQLELRDQSQMKRVLLRMGYDWIDFTYDETKKVGSIFIDSSFGSWCNGWSHMGDDTTLPEFFLRADKYYLANKLWDHDEKTDYFDSGDANEELKKDIIRSRREGSLDAEEARKYYDAVDELENEASSFDSWISQYYDAELGEYNQEIWDISIGWKKRSKYLSLQDLIIPAIKKYFAGELSIDNVDEVSDTIQREESFERGEKSM